MRACVREQEEICERKRKREDKPLSFFVRVRRERCCRRKWHLVSSCERGKKTRPLVLSLLYSHGALARKRHYLEALPALSNTLRQNKQAHKEKEKKRTSLSLSVIQIRLLKRDHVAVEVLLARSLAAAKKSFEARPRGTGSPQEPRRPFQRLFRPQTRTAPRRAGSRAGLRTVSRGYRCV